jgi:uncharacterized membrane protein
MSVLGQRIAPARFLAFVAIFVVASVGFHTVLPTGRTFMVGFDVAALSFFVLILPVLRTGDTETMRRRASENDANRTVLLVITGCVMVAILASVGGETMAKMDGPWPRLLIVVTLVISWLFSNLVYALHYAHLYYAPGSGGGLNFSGDDEPDYFDFIYFAFTLGMTFQTSDTGVTTPRMRRVVTIHSFAAFVFNIGVLAFTINVLGSAA